MENTATITNPEYPACAVLQNRLGPGEIVHREVGLWFVIKTVVQHPDDVRVAQRGQHLEFMGQCQTPDIAVLLGGRA